MSGLQALIVVIAVALLIALFVGFVVLSSRSAQRRTDRISRDLGIPLPEEVESAPAVDTLEPPVVEPPAVEPAPPARPRLRDRLGKTRAALSESLRSVTRRPRIDDETWDDLEDALLLADVGVATTRQILADLRAQAATERIADPEALVALLRSELVAKLVDDGARELARAGGGPTVWLFVGVNGVGKTTTIAKLARRERDVGRKVMLAAADTFRAAAAEQLEEWGTRIDAPVVRGQQGADPGSVVHDAMTAASGRQVDVVLVDTAGRLHTKVNLMEELKKIRRIVERTPNALQEVLLVIDATTGQNGLEQARVFTEAVGVTGVVLTKLDGTAKGGIVLGIERELDLPVKIVGVGEGATDLVPFDPEEFVAAVLE